MHSAKFALTHASGMLAEALLERMAEAGIKSENIVLLDHEDHEGERIAYAGSFLTVKDQDAYDYENLTAVLLLESAPVLQELLQHAECYVVSHLSGQGAVSQCRLQTLIQNGLPEAPCFIQLASADQASLIPVLELIDTSYGLSSLNVTHVDSAAAFGHSGVKELASQTISLLNSQDVKSSVFPLALAFNMMPIELDQQAEYRLLEYLQIEGLKCSVQKLLVAAFHGQAISVMLETDREIDIEALSIDCEKLPGFKISLQSVSPMTHCKKGFDVYISALRHPQKDVKRLQFWLIADSVRNGLIQNYINAMEILLKSYL